MVNMIFKPASRYPADPRAVFMLAVSVFSGATALALQAAPDSLRSILPIWAVILWGTMLTGGSLLTLIGMYFQSVNGIIMEQVGSMTVAVTTVFYSTIIFFTLGAEAIQTIGIILSWGLACFIRWIQLQILIHSSIKRAQKREFLSQLEEEIQARVEREKHGWMNR